MPASDRASSATSDHRSLKVLSAGGGRCDATEGARSRPFFYNHIGLIDLWQVK